MGVYLNVGVYYGFLIWCEFDKEKLLDLLAKGGLYLEEWLLDHHREEEMEGKEVDNNWELVSDMDSGEENWYMLVYKPLTQYDAMKTRGSGGAGTPVDPEKMVVPEEVKEEAKRLRVILMGSEEEEEESSQDIDELADIEGPRFFAYAHFA